MQERIIILGAGVMQGPAIRIAKELGFYTVVVDGSSSALHKDMADQFEQIDLKDKEGIETFARSLQNSGGLGGIMTAGTDFSATVAWVTEKLGLPGIPYEAALNASDKSLMRACFKKAGLPSPEYTVIGSGEWGVGSGEWGVGNKDQRSLFELLGVNKEVPLDSELRSLLPTPYSLLPSLVIKPVDNMGGRGCRRVDSMDEFDEAATDALRFSRSGRAIVEAFMDGPEFSVDAIVYHGEITICGLADRHIFFPPYFIEMGHTMPTIIPPEQQAVILETFCAGVRALGLADDESIGAAKGDIKLTPKGPMIGEIAARLSGGYMSGWTYPYSSGVEPIRAAILAAMGRKPDGLTPLKTWTSAERAFISIPGTVKAITGTETARSNPLVKDLFLRIAKGDKVSFPENNVSKCGNIISVAPERIIAIEAAENAARSILIRLDPADHETAEFLGSGGTDTCAPLRGVDECISNVPAQENSAVFSKDSSPLGERTRCGQETENKYRNPNNSLKMPIFPPDAYQLNPELKAALLTLPETNLANANTPSPRRSRQPEGCLPSSGAADSTCAGTGHIHPSTPLDEALPSFPHSPFFIPYSSSPTPHSPLPPENSTRTGERVDEQMFHGVGQVKPSATVKSEGPPTPLSLLPFPEFTTSGLKDYIGRDVIESLKAVRQLTGLLLPEIQVESMKSTDNKCSFLGKSFWVAFVRGGYQGAVYYIDKLRGEN